MVADTKVQNAATFTMLGEEHTIGNVVRMCVRFTTFSGGDSSRCRCSSCTISPLTLLRPSRELIADENVLFVGYQIPHPLMHEMKVRVSPRARRSGRVVPAWRRLRGEEGLLNPVPLLPQIHTTGKDRKTGRAYSPEDALLNSLENLQNELAYLDQEFTARLIHAAGRCLPCSLLGRLCSALDVLSGCLLLSQRAVDKALSDRIIFGGAM